MARLVDPKNLVSASEIADRLGCTRPQIVHTWRGRFPDFPEPIAVLKQSMIWNWPDIEKWARRTGRLK